jgi:hypothetical protein
VKTENVRLRSYPSSPRGQGTAPSFYRPRGGGLQSCHTVLATYGGMVCSAVELFIVLANLAPGGASWRLMCPSRDDFEGGAVETSCLVVICMPARGAG